MMLAFILEGLGTTELLVIVVVALILFGPRKLPQLSRSLAKSLGEFKRASEDFKRTWEKEVTLEERAKEAAIERAMLPEDNSILADTVERRRAVNTAAAEGGAPQAVMSHGAPHTSSAADSSEGPPDEVSAAATTPTTEASSAAPVTKRDWL